MKKLFFVAWFFWMLETSVLQADPLSHQDPKKHLVLDTRVIDRVENALLVLGSPVKEERNPLLKADQPWENSLNNLYANVIYDPDVRQFKMWYGCVLADKDAIAKMDPPRTVHDVGWYELYAVSDDGIAWTRPVLDLFAFAGSKKNNAVVRDTPNVGVFRDTNPQCSPERRYKMIYDVGLGKMRVRFSANGIHWSEPVEPKGLGARTGDTHNNAFWDARLGKYVLITRFVLGERLVARAESKDFVHWENERLALRSTLAEGKSRQCYCMPAFAYGSAYLGFLMMYNAATDRTVDCELTWSPDTVRWYRVKPGEAFLPRGPGKSYDSKCIYAQANPPILHQGKLHIYYGGSDYPHIGWKRHCLPCLARLRLDGFAGYRPQKKEQPAQLVSHPLRWNGDLRLSADVATGGSVRVILESESAGEQARSRPITTDSSDGPVVWEKVPAGELVGCPLRLRFELANATLYAFHGPELLPTPEIHPPVRHFNDSLTVQLQGPKERIRFTLDGSNPTARSSLYEKPLVIRQDTLIKTRLFEPNHVDGGPIAEAKFIRRVPWDQLHPGQPKPVKRVQVHFDDNAEGWAGTESLTHHAEGGLSKGYVRAHRKDQQPYLQAEDKASRGELVGDWQQRFGGSGVKISLAVRASQPGPQTRLEIFGKNIASWAYARLPAPGKDWQAISTTLRFDWTDAEAEAAGWHKAPHAFTWQETMQNVGRVVLAPAVMPTGEAIFDVDEVLVETVYE